MNTPQNIIVHHTAVSRTKNANQFQATKNYHISKGWGDISYHYLIEPDGAVKKGRADNVEGAHCKEMEMNFFSLGICLTGNFDEEEPTIAQCQSLLDLIRQKQKEYHIQDNHVVPHRKYATYKSCWGKLLPDDIMGYCKKRLASPAAPTITPEFKESVEKAKNLGIITNWSAPQDPMRDIDIQNMLHKAGLLKEVDENHPISRERWAVILDRAGRLG